MSKFVRNFCFLFGLFALYGGAGAAFAAGLFWMLDALHGLGMPKWLVIATPMISVALIISMVGAWRLSRD